MPVDPRTVLERLRHVLGEAVAPPEAADGGSADDAELGEPADHRGAAAGLSRGVLIVCVVAVLVAALLFWRGRPVAQEAPSSVAGLGTPVVASADPSIGPGSATPATRLVVHVIGRVNKPGLVRLAPGARVADAIEAAGGLKPGTDPATVNLARPVTDGEQVDIGAPSASGPATGGGTSSGGAASSGGTAGGLIDLNTATVEQLDSLPGVGPVLAQRIVDHRTQNGRFTAVDDLRQVSGIGEKKYADLAPLVRV